MAKNKTAIKWFDPEAWNCYAGGTCAEEGYHSHDMFLPEGRYTIQPTSYSADVVNERNGKHNGYTVYFLNEKGALPGGLWQELGERVNLRKARALCRDHYSAHFSHKLAA